MPHKNTIRKYFSGGSYHIYNRGVEKRIIFKNRSDYAKFISIIESYMTPKTDLSLGIPITHTPYWRSKLEKDEVEIVSFCLMPNHFHFLLKQNTRDGVTKFMRRISNAYVNYFNKKYKREGTLFQGKFKAVLIDTDAYLLHLSRYIHLNPIEVRPLNIGRSQWLLNYPYSSYMEYLGKRKTKWIKHQIVLDFFRKNGSLFKKAKTYKQFVESYISKTENQIKSLTLD